MVHRGHCWVAGLLINSEPWNSRPAGPLMMVWSISFQDPGRPRHRSSSAQPRARAKRAAGFCRALHRDRGGRGRRGRRAVQRPTRRPNAGGVHVSAGKKHLPRSCDGRCIEKTAEDLAAPKTSRPHKGRTPPLAAGMLNAASVSSTPYLRPQRALAGFAKPTKSPRGGVPANRRRRAQLNGRGALHAQDAAVGREVSARPVCADALDATGAGAGRNRVVGRHAGARRLHASNGGRGHASAGGRGQGTPRARAWGVVRFSDLAEIHNQAHSASRVPRQRCGEAVLRRQHWRRSRGKADQDAGSDCGCTEAARVPAARAARGAERGKATGGLLACSAARGGSGSNRSGGGAVIERGGADRGPPTGVEHLSGRRVWLQGMAFPWRPRAARGGRAENRADENHAPETETFLRKRARGTGTALRT